MVLLEQDDNVKFIISERSILTDKNVFAKMLYDSDIISKMDYDIYQVFYDTHSNFMKNIVMVYIRTDPIICQKRIQKRNRKGEELIPLEYLQMCHNYHESWIMNDTIKHKMVINGNNSHDNNKNQLKSWINEFETFISFYNEHFIKEKFNFLMNSSETIQRKRKNIIMI